MNNQSDKMLESVKYILQNIDISSFKAEFDLETKQVKVELLAEFEGLSKEMANVKNMKDITHKDKKNQISVIEPEPGPTVRVETTKNETEDEKTVVKDPAEQNLKEDYPSVISKKLDHFLTSGIAPSEKKKLNGKQDAV
jgi:hypothetical protein